MADISQNTAFVHNEPLEHFLGGQHFHRNELQSARLGVFDQRLAVLRDRLLRLSDDAQIENNDVKNNSHSLHHLPVRVLGSAAVQC